MRHGEDANNIFLSQGKAIEARARNSSPAHDFAFQFDLGDSYFASPGFPVALCAEGKVHPFSHVRNVCQGYV